MAERSGYTVVDPPSIIATHMTELIRKHASEVLGRQEVQKMLDKLKPDYGTVIEEVKKVASVGACLAMHEKGVRRGACP